MSSILSQFIGGLIPEGVVKDFFLSSRSIGWGIKSDNWVDLLIYHCFLCSFSSFPDITVNCSSLNSNP